MKKRAGLWIDRRKAVIVTMTGAGEESNARHVELEVGLGGVATTRLTTTIPPA